MLTVSYIVAFPCCEFVILSTIITIFITTTKMCGIKWVGLLSRRMALVVRLSLLQLCMLVVCYTLQCSMGNESELLSDTIELG